MKTIPLTQGLVALIDDDDFERVNAFKWTASRTSRTRVYAVHGEWLPEKKRNHPVYMHRFVLHLRDPAIRPDHIDGNGLNNQKSNLRVATPQLNSANSSISITNTTGFKGVSFDHIRRLYRAAIKVNQRQTFLGRYSTAEEAARAYDAAAIAAFGEFARVNFRKE